MAIQSIASGLPAASALPGASSASSPALGQTDFLKLLMTQMKNQDPLNPVSGTDFTAQLAQFSSLQGVQQLNTSINQMLVLQQVTQGASLIGKQVTFVASGKSVPSSGVVSAVQVTNGNVQLVVGNQAVSLSQVMSISSGS